MLSIEAGSKDIFPIPFQVFLSVDLWVQPQPYE